MTAYIVLAILYMGPTIGYAIAVLSSRYDDGHINGSRAVVLALFFSLLWPIAVIITILVAMKTTAAGTQKSRPWSFCARNHVDRDNGSTAAELERTRLDTARQHRRNHAPDLEI